MNFILILNLCLLSVSIFGFVLFSWWWWKNKNASTIYAYITILFANEIFACLFYLKSIFNNENNYFVSIWPFNLSAKLFIFSGIIINVVFQIYKTIKERKVNELSLNSFDSKTFNNEILIIDDCEQVVSLLKNGFKMAFPNLKIFSCNNAENAFEVISNHRNISLIICDLRLPGMNGFDFCEIIKKSNPQIVFIGMTGYIEKYEFINARKKGFDDYIEKPFKVATIIKIVERELSKLQSWKVIGINQIKERKMK